MTDPSRRAGDLDYDTYLDWCLTSPGFFSNVLLIEMQFWAGARDLAQQRRIRKASE